MSDKDLTVAHNGTGITSALADDQRIALNQPTPKAIISQVSKGGGRYDYVPHSYFTQKLNEIFGHVWSWEIIGHEIIEGEVVVHGRLKVMCKDGIVITKDAFGGSKIKRYGDNHKTQAGKPMSIGNDLKSASSDAKKKAASELGIALDVYAPILDEVGLIEVNLSEEDKSVLFEHAQHIEKCTSADALDLKAEELAKLEMTTGQRDYIRNIFLIRKQQLTEGGGIEKVIELLKACKTLEEHKKLTEEVSRGQHGQFTENQWREIKEVSTEVKKELSELPVVTVEVSEPVEATVQPHTPQSE